MSDRLEEIAARKQELLARSDLGCYEMAQVYYKWQARTQVTRQITGFFRNPLVLAGLGLLALKMPWRRAYRWSGWLWRGWKTLRIFRRMFI